MFRNQLIALEHPTPNSIDYSDRTQFASTVLWLEDQKIRHYTIEDRDALRQIGASTDWLAAWDGAYAQYKRDVNMPVADSPLEELSWLMSYAVRLEYLDHAEEYVHVTSAHLSEVNGPSAQPTIVSKNPYDNLDTESDAFKKGIIGLAEKLSIAQHPDHLVQLQAIARFIDERLRPEALAEQLPTGMAFPIKEGSKCAFDDADVDQAAKILRLLQIHNVRALQTVINETIVVVQQLTADPKTDTNLGKVGH